jgi:PAS domain S-box-containing protein
MIFRALSRFLLGTLRGRLIIGVALVHAVMMTLFVADLTERQRTMLLERQIEEATALSQALATSAAGWIAADDISGLQELVEVQRRYPELLFATLVDNEGRVLADTDKSKRGLHLLDLPGEPSQTVFSSSPALVDVATPSIIGGRHVGWARVGIGQKTAGEKLAGIIRNGVIYALAAILIGSVIAWFMGRGITRRLYAVQETIDAIRSGNRLARSPLTGTDEAALMAREFNAMLDALAKRDTDLHSSEERYRSLIHKVQTAIVLHDGQGLILNSNPLAQELLGLSSDQLLGKALIDPEWRFLREDSTVMPVAEYPVSRVLSSRQPLRGFVVGISRPDRKDVTWALINAEPDYDAAGEIAQVIVSFVDITERKLTEEALLRLNRELRAISNCNQALMRSEDEQTLVGDTCRIVCDDAGYRMAWVGYAENDEAKTIRPVAWAGVEDGYLAQAGITWADMERGRGPSGTAIRSGKSACFQDFGTDPLAAPWRESALQRGYRSSISMPLKDENANTFGILTIYSTEPNAFTADETRLLEALAGDLAFGIMVLRERKERARAEERLRRNERSLIEAQRIAHLGNWELDLLNNVLTWSDEIYRIFEIDPEKFGASYEAFLNAIHPDDRDMVNAAYTNSVINKTPYNIVHRLRMPDGRLKYVSEMSKTYYAPDGKPLRSVGTVHDITERKLAEEEIRQLNQDLEQRVAERTAQLEIANKELEAFAYSVSHDLRAPLRHIDGFLDMLNARIGTTLDAKSLHYMNTISDSAKRMGTLIDDLLAFSRAARCEMTTTNVDLRALIQEIIQDIAPETQGRSIDWRIGQLPVVTGDRAMLRIVLVNLISNAVKFTKKREKADIEIGCLPGSDQDVTVFVRDNGAGFDMRYVDKLFGVFQRLHRIEDFEGTGIGLANVHRIISRHGGKTWAEGKIDSGATFYFSLPRCGPSQFPSTDHEQTAKVETASSSEQHTS